MKTLPLTLSLLAGALVLGACGTTSQVDYRTWVDDYGQALTDAESRTAEHGQAVQSDTSLAAVQADEDAYLQDMAEHHDAMLHLADDMEGCQDAQGRMPMHMAGMHDEVAGLRDELEAHHQAMLDAVDLTAADAEETRHQEAMGALYDDMDALHDEMMNDAGDYTCPAHDDAWMQDGHMMTDGGWDGMMGGWGNGGMMGGGWGHDEGSADAGTTHGGTDGGMMNGYDGGGMYGDTDGGTMNGYDGGGMYGDTDGGMMSGYDGGAYGGTDGGTMHGGADGGTYDGGHGGGGMMGDGGMH